MFKISLILGLVSGMFFYNFTHQHTGKRIYKAEIKEITANANDQWAYLPIDSSQQMGIVKTVMPIK